MARNENSIFYGVDRVTLLVYVILVFMGWLNIYAAVYDEEHQNIFDTTQKYGMQLIWIGGAAIIAFSILLIDANFYTVFAYGFYGFFLLANILVLFLGREVKGSHSWYRFGKFGIQPAEFMKFATSLALAYGAATPNLQQTSRPEESKTRKEKRKRDGRRCVRCKQGREMQKRGQDHRQRRRRVSPRPLWR